MSSTGKKHTMRRDFLEDSGRIAAAIAVTSAAIPPVYPGEDNTIKISLIGFGGRGTGVAANALATTSGPTRLVAMAEVFEPRLQVSLKALQDEFGSQVNVPFERRFSELDGYQKAIASLDPGDVSNTTSFLRPSEKTLSTTKRSAQPLP